VLFPNPADEVRGIVLVFRKPEFTFLTDDVENLRKNQCQQLIRGEGIGSVKIDLPLPERSASKGTRLPSLSHLC